MRWVVGIVLLMSLGHALADDQDIGTLEEWEAHRAIQAYDGVTIRFNTHIKAFPSWRAFQAEVLSKVPPGTAGTCYLSTGDRSEPIKVMKGTHLEVKTDGWQKTAGKGWRRYQTKRAFIEYRLNTEAGMLLRAEGVKAGFFFTHIQKICEFSLTS
jgi:hypothetical protein